MKKYVYLLILPLLVFACSEEKAKNENTKNTVAIAQNATIYTTQKDSDLRLTKSGSIKFKELNQPLENEISVFVNPEKSFQDFLGIGGAITDASSEVFAKMPELKQKQLLKAYYDEEEGIAYSLMRTNIHSCDFSSGSYTYIDEGDKELNTFSIEHDRKYRIPLIKKAFEIAGKNMKLYGSPWSPPAFMKDSKNMLQGGSLLPEYYLAWAKYFTKFVEAYEKEGIPVWGISIQNEPMATQTWESCIFTAQEERDFLRDFLGPQMENSGLGDKKIIVWDHNRDLINHRANTILGDPEAAKYAWGVGFHWYEDWAGEEQMFDNLEKVAEAFPEKALIFTEGCNGGFDAESYHYWPNAERYGRSMINDFNKGTVAWTDWNILLDERGGPNHVGNFCFAPVHYDVEADSLIFTPSYYYLGHFSKFIRPNAKRISTVTSRSNLLATTFKNEDNSMVSVVMNSTDFPIDYKFYVGQEGFTTSIKAHAIQTFIY